MIEKLLLAELVVVAFGTVSRTMATMSGRSFPFNKSVPRCLLEVGLVDNDVVESVFLFPFHLEVVDVDVTAGRGCRCYCWSWIGLCRSYTFSGGTYDLFFSEVLLQFTRPRGTVHALLFLLVLLYGSIIFKAITYAASQAVIILTLTLFNRLNFMVM